MGSYWVRVVLCIAALGCGGNRDESRRTASERQKADAVMPPSPSAATMPADLGSADACPYPSIDPPTNVESELGDRDYGFAFDKHGRVGSEAIQCQRLGSLPLPTGSLVLLDPTMPFAMQPLPVELPAGDHPVFTSRRRDHGDVVFTLIRFAEARPATWTSAGRPLSIGDVNKAWPPDGCCAAAVDRDSVRWLRMHFGRADPPAPTGARLDKLFGGSAALVQHRRNRHAFPWAGRDENGTVVALAFDLGQVADWLLRPDRQGNPVPVGRGACPSRDGPPQYQACPWPRTAAGSDPTGLSRAFDEDHTCEFVGELVLPTGRIVATDPLVFAKQPALPHEVSPGRYRVFLRTDDRRTHHYAALVFIGTKPAVRWEKAFAYGVDSGTGAFMDVHAANISIQHNREALLEDHPEQDPLLTAKLGHAATCYDIDGETGANVLMFTSGQGDGVYNSYIGYDATGAVVAVATVFDDL